MLRIDLVEHSYPMEHLNVNGRRSGAHDCAGINTASSTALRVEVTLVAWSSCAYVVVARV
jgi:hypothetical protein